MGIKCQVCGSEENVVVCNSVLGAALSIAYCSRCVHDELATWGEIVGTVHACGGFDHLAPWAEQIIDRSLVFHEKKRADVSREMLLFDSKHLDG